MVPRLSVCVPTYNHERFIARALEGALNQRTSFEYEIVVGDDCSTDGTRDILQTLHREHSGTLRLLLHERNLGLWGKLNFIEILKRCRGDYVALLEGDDYWTDPWKLQKQVDFLDRHPDCVICFHDVITVDSNGRESSPAVSGRTRYSLEDLLKGNFIYTCSVVFRRGLFGDFPGWFYDVMMGDWALHILNAQHGWVGRLPEAMGAYRVHDGGVWTPLRATAQALDQIRLFDSLSGHLARRHRRAVGLARARAHAYLSESYYQEGDFDRARAPLLKSLGISLALGSIPPARRIGRLVKLQVLNWTAAGTRRRRASR
jgi:glycosyltransferase involved in cell wall biosynthesis